ncbi:MAG TPA: hypothetical protein VM580_09100, partial [Labilithrix sp.]|nr:hypothetical protein [Labilithrix sp.]
MLLTGVIPKAELFALIAALTPLRVTIDERRGRSVTLNRPQAALIAGKGLRLRGDARVVWDVAGVPIPVTLQTWQLVLVPRIVSRGAWRVLAFEPVVEKLDLRHVPGFVDEKIVTAIRDALARGDDKLAWNFSRTLSKRWPLSAKLLPLRDFELVAADGAVTVTDAEVRLEL